jgi:hypothetical protein
MAGPKNFKDVNRALRQIESVINSKKTSSILGNEAKDAIFKRTKTGFGVKADKTIPSSRKKLKKLSPAYIEQRKRYGVQGKFGSPEFSNLTNTGQMLDSIVLTAGHGQFTLIIPNTVRKKRGKEKGTKTNAQVAQHVSDNGRPWFNLTTAELRIVEQNLSSIINKIIKQTIG